MAGEVRVLPAGWAAHFPRKTGQAYDADLRVGLYATEQEAQKVVDLLRLKAAIDSGTPFEEVVLHLPLQEYTANSSTMQYLQGHDVDAVWDTFHACGAERLQPAGSDGWGVADEAAEQGWWALDEEDEDERAEADSEEEEEDARRGGRAASSASAGAQQLAEAGSGQLNAAGRPKRSAALRRKLPAEAPEDRPRTLGAAKRKRQQQMQREAAAAAAAHEAAAAREAAAAAAAERASVAVERGDEGRGSVKRQKTIIFPPVPASMKCNQCVNCQNPQRKRPCVLARRKLLDLLRQQEEVEGGLYGDGGAAEEVPAEPAVTASTGGGALSGSAGPASPRIALPPGMQFPGRKQLFPIIPPSERCGQCKACLNPKLKRACIEARKRQLEAGLAVRLPSAQYNSPSSPRAGVLASGGGGVGGKRATAVATAAAVAAGQALGPALCGCRVRVYWAGMSRWYEGRITGYSSKDGSHFIEYDDGDQQHHILGEEKYVLLDPPKRVLRTFEDEEEGEEEEDGMDYEQHQQHQPPAAHWGRSSGAAAAAESGPAEALGSSGGVRRRVAALTAAAAAAAAAEAPGPSGGGSGGSPGPDTPAGAAGGKAPLLLQSSPVPPAVAAAREAVVALPAALAACCRKGSERAEAAAAAGISAALVGRFMAAFSCRMSEGQRQETAAFLGPLLEVDCFEGVQACMEEAVLACQQAATTTATAPTSLAANGSQQQAEQPARRAVPGQAAESQRGDSELQGEAAEGAAAAPGTTGGAAEAPGQLPAGVQAEQEMVAAGGEPGALSRQLPLMQLLAPPTEAEAGGDAAGHAGAATSSGDGSASDSREEQSSGTGAGQGSSRAVQAAAAGTTHYPAATTEAAKAAAVGTTHYPVHFPPC